MNSVRFLTGSCLQVVLHACSMRNIYMYLMMIPKKIDYICPCFFLYIHYKYTTKTPQKQNAKDNSEHNTKEYLTQLSNVQIYNCISISNMAECIGPWRRTRYSLKILRSEFSSLQQYCLRFLRALVIAVFKAEFISNWDYIKLIPFSFILS